MHCVCIERFNLGNWLTGLWVLSLKSIGQASRLEMETQGRFLSFRLEAEFLPLGKNSVFSHKAFN
jgi:hypothetical protein